MADEERSSDQVMHDLAVANDAGERPPGRQNAASADDTEVDAESREDDGGGPPDEPPPT